MGRKIIIVLCICLLTNGLWAQSNPSEQINEIKKQTEKYLYGEGTMAKQKDALDVAKQYLMPYIKAWMRKNYIDVTDENMVQVESHVQYLETRRGSMYRVLAYILKTDLENMFGVVAEETPPVIPPVDPDPVTTTVVDQSPEPNRTNIESNPTIPETYNIPDDGGMDEGLDEGLDATILTPIEEEMLNVKAEGIGAFIKKLESEYKLSRYGKYADMPADINCYLFVYDRTKTIVAYLRKEGDIYINLQNGTMDDIQNYKGCGAIWFRIKNY